MRAHRVILRMVFWVILSLVLVACQLLGLRHRDGWQELLSGTTLTASRARLSGRAGWRGVLRTHGSSTVSSAAGPVRIGSPLLEA